MNSTDFIPCPAITKSFMFLLTAVLVISCSGKTEKVNEKAGGDKHEEVVAASDTMNISGSLICAHCYALNDENTGHDHELPKSGFKEDCAGFCSLQGYPIAVLLDEEFAGSKVWVIRTSAQLFADFMTETVKIKGTFVSKGVIEPLSIDLRRDGESEYEWVTIM